MPNVQPAGDMPVSQVLDTVVNLIDTARADGNKVLQGLPRTAPLFVSVDLVTALGHLRRAALLIDGASDSLEADAQAVAR